MSPVRLRPALSRGHLDRFGFAHAGHPAAALDAFAHATEGLAAYRPDMMEAIDSALAAAPGMVAAEALRGMAFALAARPAALAQAAACLANARREGAVSRDESALVRALAAVVEVGFRAGADVLDTHLAAAPPGLLMVKLATMLRFIGGDAAGMRRTTERAVAAWDPGQPGHGYVLGCHAFALEETGDLPAAERVGRQAVAMEPRDPWAVHAVAHVLEMTGQAQVGVAWIAACRPGWADCNSFSRHLVWHQALFHLELGDPDTVLALYDTAIRPDRSEDNRDVANAISLLWRLRQDGVDVGTRWEELADLARRTRRETTLVFASLHRLLALIAAGDALAATDAVAALAASACEGMGEQADVAASVGLPLARALMRLLPGGTCARQPLDCIAARFDAMGGSIAQRDVFLRCLVRLAAARQDHILLARLLEMRGRRDRFQRAASDPH